jgi:hypothetical protein
MNIHFLKWAYVTCSVSVLADCRFLGLSISLRSRDSSVGIVAIPIGYGLDGRGVGGRVPVGSSIFSSPRCPDWPWGSPSLLSNGYLGLFPQEYRGSCVKLTISLQQVPRSRKCGSIQPLPIRPYGVVIN